MNFIVKCTWDIFKMASWSWCMDVSEANSVTKSKAEQLNIWFKSNRYSTETKKNQ